MKEDEFLSLFKPLSEIPEADTSYFLPWSLDMLYQIEPSLRDIARQAIAHRKEDFYKKLDVYITTKEKAYELVGWGARDPRLRQSEAWDCYFDYILEALKL